MTLIKNNHSDVKEFIPRTFSDIIDNFFNENAGPARVVKFLPSVDVVEEEKSFEIQVALPGLKKEDIKIEFLDNKLTVSGERKLVKEENGKKYHTVETQYGSFKRSFYLPETINAGGIEAAYVDGILKITLPKDEKKITKTTIEVK